MLWFEDYRSSAEVPGTADTTGRRGPVSRAETEQGLKGGHGLSPAIVTKDELIQVDGKLGTADAVVALARFPLIDDGFPRRPDPLGQLGLGEGKVCPDLPQLLWPVGRHRCVPGGAWASGRSGSRTACSTVRRRPSSVIRLSTLHASTDSSLALRESGREVDRRESTCIGRRRSPREPGDGIPLPSSTGADSYS